ncbi:MAG: methyltransferase family protein, partial [Gammaproteobacteria bacterium]
MTGKGPGAPDPAPIMALSTAYWGSQVLLTANRVGLFDVLAGGPKSSAQVAEALGIATRPADLLLKSLVGLGMIERDGQGFVNGALARAFLKDAPFVVLDEATAHVDPESEILIRAALRQLLSGRTALII